MWTCCENSCSEWKVLSFASFNLLGPEVFVEVGALIINKGTTAYIIKCAVTKTKLINILFLFDGWVGHNNQKHCFYLGGGEYKDSP